MANREQQGRKRSVPPGAYHDAQEDRTKECFRRFLCGNERRCSQATIASFTAMFTNHPKLAEFSFDDAGDYDFGRGFNWCCPLFTALLQYPAQFHLIRAIHNGCPQHVKHRHSHFDIPSMTCACFQSLSLGVVRLIAENDPEAFLASDAVYASPLEAAVRSPHPSLEVISFVAESCPPQIHRGSPSPLEHVLCRYDETDDHNLEILRCLLRHDPAERSLKLSVGEDESDLLPIGPMKARILGDHIKNASFATLDLCFENWTVEGFRQILRDIQQTPQIKRLGLKIPHQLRSLREILFQYGNTIRSLPALEYVYVQVGVDEGEESDPVVETIEAVARERTSSNPISVVLYGSRQDVEYRKKLLATPALEGLLRCVKGCILQRLSLSDESLDLFANSIATSLQTFGVGWCTWSSDCDGSQRLSRAVRDGSRGRLNRVYWMAENRETLPIRIDTWTNLCDLLLIVDQDVENQDMRRDLVALLRSSCALESIDVRESNCFRHEDIILSRYFNLLNRSGRMLLRTDGCTKDMLVNCLEEVAQCGEKHCGDITKRQARSRPGRRHVDDDYSMTKEALQVSLLLDLLREKPSVWI